MTSFRMERLAQTIARLSSETFRASGGSDLKTFLKVPFTTFLTGLRPRTGARNGKRVGRRVGREKTCTGAGLEAE